MSNENIAIVYFKYFISENIATVLFKYFMSNENVAIELLHTLWVTKMSHRK